MCSWLACSCVCARSAVVRVWATVSSSPSRCRSVRSCRTSTRDPAGAVVTPSRAAAARAVGGTDPPGSERPGDRTTRCCTTRTRPPAARLASPPTAPGRAAESSVGSRGSPAPSQPSRRAAASLCRRARPSGARTTTPASSESMAVSASRNCSAICSGPRPSVTRFRYRPTSQATSRPTAATAAEPSRMPGIWAWAMMATSEICTPVVTTPRTVPSSGSTTGASARTERPAAPVLESSTTVSPATTASTGFG